MDRLIIEIETRGLNQYHKIDRFPITVGRAYDNDIILSDKSIAPHHLMIDRGDDGQLIIHPLSETHTSLLNDVPLKAEKVAQKVVPFHLQLGQLQTRVLFPSTPIESERHLAIKKRFCLPKSEFWSIFLFLFAIFVVFIDEWLKIASKEDGLTYLPHLLGEALLLLAIALLISGISRLATHHWHIFMALSVSSLNQIIPILAEHLGHALDYLLTANYPSNTLLTIIGFVLLPLLLYLFITCISRATRLRAIGIALLGSSLLIGFQIHALVTEWSFNHNAFSDEASYNQTLSSTDIRLKNTISIETFLKEAAENIESQLEAE